MWDGWPWISGGEALQSADSSCTWVGGWTGWGASVCAFILAGICRLSLHSVSVQGHWFPLGIYLLWSWLPEGQHPTCSSTEFRFSLLSLRCKYLQTSQVWNFESIFWNTYWLRNGLLSCYFLVQISCHYKKGLFELFSFSKTKFVSSTDDILLLIYNPPLELWDSFE